MKLARTSLFLSFVAAVLLLVASGSAAAAPLAMEIDFLNSNLTFGGPSFNHYGYDNDYLTL
jgi:hypothetical protein